MHKYQIVWRNTAQINVCVHLKAWRADTLSCHTVAVCTILALTYLLALLTVEASCTRLITVDTWPTRLARALTWYRVAAGEKHKTLFIYCFILTFYIMYTQTSRPRSHQNRQWYRVPVDSAEPILMMHKRNKKRISLLHYKSEILENICLNSTFGIPHLKNANSKKKNYFKN